MPLPYRLTRVDYEFRASHYAEYVAIGDPAQSISSFALWCYKAAQLEEGCSRVMKGAHSNLGSRTGTIWPLVTFVDNIIRSMYMAAPALDSTPLGDRRFCGVNQSGNTETTSRSAYKPASRLVCLLLQLPTVSPSPPLLSLPFPSPYL